MAVTLRGLPPKIVRSDGFELMKSIGDVKIADAAAALAANVSSRSSRRRTSSTSKRPSVTRPPGPRHPVNSW
jgi:hypothetical protein